MTSPGAHRSIPGLAESDAIDILPARHDDLDGLSELLARSGEHSASRSRELLAIEWVAPGFVLDHDAWVAREGSKLVGYAAVSPAGMLRIAVATREIGDALILRATRRARSMGIDELDLALPESDGMRVTLAERHGFECGGGTLVMWRPLAGELPAASWPNGVSVRAFELTDAAAVHGLLEEAYGAWDPGFRPEPFEEWVTRMTGDPEFEADLWWLAARGNALVGCALFWTSGWLKDLAVRRSERRKGTGAALVAQGFRAFSERGVPRVGLKVDRDNPTGAIRLYERLGFVVSARESLWSLRL